MNVTDVNILDSFSESNLKFVTEKSIESEDKSIDGTPISDEIKENSKNKGIIGKIGGIGADSNKATRNGRRYPIELWQNVEKSEYFIEGMENRTLIGEADHPQERLDYSVTEGAVVLTKYEIQDNGQVYTEFDILDTLPGRTVKTYFEAGCKLGVSSRGAGEEVVRNGETIIDPDTYQFYCFDVVAFPAVKSARMELIESTSPKKQKLINSITTEIKNCKSLDEVRFIESMSQGVNLYLDEIKESIEIKKEELNNKSSHTMISQCDNPESAAKAAEELLKDFEQIGEVNRTDNDKKFIEYLKNQLNEYKATKNENVQSLFNQLKEECLENEDENNKIKISEPDNISDEDTPEVVDRNSDNLEILAELQEEVETKNSNIDELNRQLEQKNQVIRNLLAKSYNQENKLQESKNISKKLIANKKDTEKSSLSTINKLENTLQEKQNVITKLENMNNNLKRTNSEFSQIVEALNNKCLTLDDERKTLSEQLTSMSNKNSKLNSTNVKLQESLNSNKIYNDNVSSLKEKVNALETSNNTLILENKEFKEAYETKSKQCEELRSQNLATLNKYIEMICTKYNLNKDTLCRLLGESYTFKDIDAIANELIENQSKINSLPFRNLVPNRQVYVENVGLSNGNDVDVESNLNSFNFMLGQN